MHRDHDLDLISALAEGRLSDPSPAEALVSSCEECARMYRAHLTVREAVAAEDPPQMNDLERARLHTALWEEVDASAPSRSGSSPSWWYRLAPVAAVVVLVAAVGLSDLLGSGDDAGQETAGRVSADSDAGSDDQPTELAPLADTSESASEEAEGADEHETQMVPDDDADGTAETMSDLTTGELAEAADAFRGRAVEGPLPDLFDCPAPSGEERAVAVEAARVEGEPVWFVALGSLGPEATVVVYTRSDCEIIFSDE